MKITRYGFSMFESGDVQSMMAAGGFKNIRLVSGQRGDGEFIVAMGTK
jgi:hypothetical protein